MDARRLARRVVAVMLTAVVLVPPPAVADDPGADGIPTRSAAGLELPCDADGGVFGL